MSNIEETKMTDEAFVELINNFEVVGHLTEYGRKAIKQKAKEMQARIKELEAKLEFKKYGDLDEIEFEKYMSQFIPKQKVKKKIREAKHNRKYANTAYEYTEEDVWDIVKDNLEELLEDN